MLRKGEKREWRENSIRINMSNTIEPGVYSFANPLMASSNYAK